MAQIAAEIASRPICPCCAGAGTHSYHAYAIGAGSPADDDEGCTNCGESGHTFHTDARPDSCSGARELKRRTRQ